MQEKYHELPGGRLLYECKDGFITVTGFHGHGSRLSVPDSIEDCPVKAVSDRAFKSNKTLHKVSLPSTLESIGDWAFAYCSELEQVTLPKKNLRLGRSIFMECRLLKRIELVPVDDQPSDTVELLAGALTFFQAYYLLDPENTGTPDWVANWDTKLLGVLRADEKEEYSRVELCGEEEYSVYDIEASIKERRRQKVRLAFLRLLNPIGLSQEIRKELVEFLLSHTKGCPSEETWEVILEEYSDEPRYYQLFISLGCLTEENFDAVLEDIGQEHSEMKAFFIRYKEETIGYRDFFSDLSLDL